MSSALWQALAAVADAAAARAAAAAGCSPRALKAGVGTALAVVAVHRLRASRRGAAAVAATGEQEDGQPAPASRAAPPAAPAAARPPSRVCVATPGVVFAGQPNVLAEGPLSLTAHAAGALAVLCAVADVYLITQVAPGEGAVLAEAAARESLIASGVVGSGVGAVPPHRALFCSTHVGRIALARQIVTDAQGVHVDGCAEAVRELARFGTRLVHVAPACDGGSGGGAAVSGAPSFASLQDYVAASGV